jgi:hypothetical protein
VSTSPNLCWYFCLPKRCSFSIAEGQARPTVEIDGVLIQAKGYVSIQLDIVGDKNGHSGVNIVLWAYA